MRNRVIIENIHPQLQGGRHAIKRIVGERVDLSADIFGDGHDAVRASLLYKEINAKKWTEVFMTAEPNDHWTVSFTPDGQGLHEYKIEAWMDHLQNWYDGFLKKHEDGQHMGVELLIGAAWLRKTAAQYPKARATKLTAMAALLEDKKGYEKAVAAILSPEFKQLVLDFPLKQFVSTSEATYHVRIRQPKNCSAPGTSYFPVPPPKNPANTAPLKMWSASCRASRKWASTCSTSRPSIPSEPPTAKEENNALTARGAAGEPGSPWAIGSKEGGHMDVHKELGTIGDYTHLIKKAKEYGIELALDLAFQCAPDHPYIKEHPEWFTWRPDGTIAYAENPPKKYQGHRSSQF